MSAGNEPRRNWVVGLLGLVGFSAIAGILLTISVAPGLALASMGAQSAIGVFDSIPDSFKLEELPERNEIYAHSGAGDVKIATVYDQNREEVPYDQMSQFVLDATVAGEDRRFFDHGGIDIAGIIRAVGQNTASGEIASGASTLTQQLVKQTYVQQAYELPTEEERQKAYNEAIAPTFDRKVKEMKIAIALEKKYTKKEILAAYLNIAYFGGQTYGIEAASQRYFGIHASQLNVAQAASLVAIVQFPDLRNLVVVADKEAQAKRFAANQDRRGYILDNMLAEGYITPEQHAEAAATPVDEAFVANGTIPQQGCRTADIYARWVCDYVVKSVKDFEFLGANEDERRAAWARGGYKIYTTVDLDMQHVAQDQLWKWTPPEFSAFRLGSAVSTVEPGTGKIRVMVENKIFDDSPTPADPARSMAVNFNTGVDYGQSHGFQPGSTYKLFTLVNWLENGHGVNEVLSAAETVIPAKDWTDSCNGTGVDYKVRNISHESGNWTVRKATEQSVNGVFLRMAAKLDLCDIAKTAAKMGAERADGNPLTTFPSDVIGTNEVSMLSMANSYATIAALGKHCEPIIVDGWVDTNGVSHPGQSPVCNQVVDPDISATVIDVMLGNTAHGTATASNPRDGVPLFTKTGTTNNAVDVLVAGATSTNATIVWVGNISGKVGMNRYSAGGGSLNSSRHKIFKALYTELNKRYGGAEFPKPSGKYFTGGTTSVPNVSGLGYTFDQAKTALEAVGFDVADGGEIDSDQKLGTIASQNPGGGSKVGGGTTVTLYRSKQNMTAIPAVTGMSYNGAVSTLGGAGWPESSISATFTCDAGYTAPGSPSGNWRDKIVTSQDPAGGSMAVAGGHVTLTVNLGTDNGCQSANPSGGGGTGGGGTGGGFGGGFGGSGN